MLTFSSSVEVSPLTSENSTERRRKKDNTLNAAIFTHTKKIAQVFNVNARKINNRGRVRGEEKEF